MSIEIHDSVETLAKEVARAIQRHLADIQAGDRVPSLVLTGGTIANRAYEQFDPGELAWDEVDVYWGDERFVPAGHEDSNAQQARDAFLDRIGADPDRVHPMPHHSCDYSMSQAADAYAQVLPASFDLVLLGLGPDGHIASLFPGHASLAVNDRDVIAEFDSPKPPPQRLSLTYPALNRASEIWFIVSGQDKAPAAARAYAGDDVERTPAAGARGRDTTRWWFDADAAAELR